MSVDFLLSSALKIFTLSAQKNTYPAECGGTRPYRVREAEAGGSVSLRILGQPGLGSEIMSPKQKQNPRNLKDRLINLGLALQRVRQHFLLKKSGRKVLLGETKVRNLSGL